MGTSLSGLTPATTFDGLLKVGDNDPLTADLKAISTGDGTDTILSLSNSALQISGETTMISDTGTFLKINDTINPSQEFSINKPFSTLEMFDLGTSANTKLRLYNTYLRFQVGGATTRLSLDISGNLGLGIENSTAAARTHIKGSGATSATTSLLVQNSAGTDMLKVQDDSSLLMYRASNGVELLKIGESGGNAILYANGNTNRSLVLGYENTLTAFNQTVFKTYNGTGYSEAMVITGNSNTDQFVGIGETTPTARLHVKGDGTANPLIVRNGAGLDVLNISNNGTVFLGLGNDATSQLHLRAGGQTLINGSSSGTLIKGTGATSATTALLVENSAGTELLKVRDDGNIYLSYNTDKQVLFPKYVMDKFRLYPLTGQNLGGDADANYQFGSAFLNDKIHITDNVASNTTADASAKLQVDSTAQGFLPPRMTDAERDAITSPAPGLMVYDTSNNQMNYWNGTTWIAF